MSDHKVPNLSGFVSFIFVPYRYVKLWILQKPTFESCLGCFEKLANIAHEAYLIYVIFCNFAFFVILRSIDYGKDFVRNENQNMHFYKNHL